MEGEIEGAINRWRVVYMERDGRRERLWRE